VGPLVTYLREERPTLCGVPIDFRLLPLGLFVEARQLPLLRLLTALAVRQSLGGTTILLNQPCVQGREAREVAHGRRARHRIVAAQDHRKGPALRVHAIQHTQSPRERVRLAGALALELCDVAPEALDLGLRPLDARVQTRDLRLL